MSSIVPRENTQSSNALIVPHHASDVSSYLKDCERYLGRIVTIIAHLVFFIFIVRFLILEPGLTDGVSMEPTMRDNSFIMIEKITPLFFTPARFTIIQLIEPKEKRREFVKRIIGLPGETVIIKQNAVFIRSKTDVEFKLNEPYLPATIVNSVPLGAQREFTLFDNEYFVMGDNRQNSNDSRAFGPVHRKLITGRVYPLGTLR